MGLQGKFAMGSGSSGGGGGSVIDLYCILGKERNLQCHNFLGNRGSLEGMLPGVTLQFPLSWLYMLSTWTWEPRINCAELWLSTI
jgi:hypothetical protein